MIDAILGSTTEPFTIWNYFFYAVSYNQKLWIEVKDAAHEQRH
jgi:hypothetical protein